MCGDWLDCAPCNSVEPRGGDTSMAGMAIAIPGVLNISKTGDTMGKIRWHRGKKQEKMAKKLIKWAKETGVSTLAIPAKVGQCRPWWSEMPPLQPTPALSIIFHPQCHGRLLDGSCWSYTGWVLTLSDLGKCRGDKQRSARVHVSVIQMIGSIVCLSCGPVAGLMVQ